jgi:hypothetical protein
MNPIQQRLTTSLIACCLAAITVPAVAGGKHEHGAGRIDVVIDGGRVTIDLDLPLDTLVGFERAPRSDKERQALAEAAAKLQDAATLFVPTPAAGCTSTRKDVAVPFAKVGSGGTANSAHADAEARYEFTCTNAAALSAIDTTVFRQFPRLYRLELQRSGPRGQGGGRLTPKAASIRW